jgi:flagellar hook-associated protein 3 FlgL
VRVSDSLIFQNATQNTQAAEQAVQSATEVASTGLAVTTPSDNPAAAGLIVNYSMQSARYTAISSATGAASSELSSASSALTSISTQLTQAQQLAEQFSSSGYSASQCASAASQVNSILAQVISDLNTKFGSRYLFGGTADSSPPFDSSGNYVGSLGNSAVRQVEIAPGVYEQSSVDASTAIAGAGGGTNVLATLQSLSTAIGSQDPTQVQAVISGLNASVSQVASALSQAGVSMNTFNTATTAATQTAANYTKATSGLADADVAGSSIALQAAQTALQATLSATAESFKLSLVDYLPS